jgi:uncharacterized membrane protein
MFALTPGNVFWPYFAGAVILLIGLFATRKEVSLARGKEKFLILGRVFFAVPMAVFAAQHFTTTKFVSQLIPSWIPEHIFWTYFVGAALLAAALSIVVKKQARLAATLLGTMLILFELFLHIPHIRAHPRDVLMWRWRAGIWPSAAARWLLPQRRRRSGAPKANLRSYHLRAFLLQCRLSSSA